MKRFKNVQEVAEHRLCCGCGACAAVCPRQAVSLADMETEGIRPFVTAAECDGCGACVAVCPGVSLRHDGLDADGGVRSLRRGWGPVHEVWEGYATNPELRFNGSSGGAASALALHAMEKCAAGRTLHIGPDPEQPWKNKTMFAVNFGQLSARTGSRYAPASPCERLREVESECIPTVFIGKPCDVAAVRTAQALRQALAGRIPLLISIFCAGTPSTNGSRELLARVGISPGEIDEFRFRGRGWPGHMAVRRDGETRLKPLMTYQQCWHILQRHRPLRCHLCPDGTGEFADISCGDPWYLSIPEDEPGQSLIVVRTERGRTALDSAMRDGYITATRVPLSRLPDAQPSLFRKRSALFGRLLALRALGAPVPAFAGFSLFHNWVRAPLGERVRSISGTFRRGLSRGYYRPQQLSRGGQA